MQYGNHAYPRQRRTLCVLGMPACAKEQELLSDPAIFIQRFVFLRLSLGPFYAIHGKGRALSLSYSIQVIYVSMFSLITLILHELVCNENMLFLDSWKLGLVHIIHGTCVGLCFGVCASVSIYTVISTCISRDRAQFTSGC